MSLEQLLETEGVEVMSEEQNDKTIVEKSKKEHMKDFLKLIVEIEQCIEPFKDQLKDTKKSYADNEWVSKEEQKALIRALRVAQKRPYTRKQFNEAMDLVRKEFIPLEGDE